MPISIFPKNIYLKSFNDSNETNKKSAECQTDELEYADSCVSTEKNKISKEVEDIKIIDT